MKNHHAVRDKHLCGIGVGDPLEVNPVGRLLIIRVIDFLGRVDRWVEVSEEATGMGLAVIDGDGVGVVGANHKRQLIDWYIT